MLKALGMKKKTVEESYTKQIRLINEDLMMARSEARTAGVRLQKAVAHMDGIDKKNATMMRAAGTDVVKNRNSYNAAYERQLVLEQKKEKLTSQKQQIRDHVAVGKMHEAMRRDNITPESLVGQKAKEAGWDEAFETAAEPDKALLARLEDEVNELMTSHYGRPTHNDDIQDEEVEAALREGAR